MAETEARALHADKARTWDRWTTIAIVALLLLPLPFARFEAWPQGGVISEHIVMPWSRFSVCYTSFPGGDAVVEAYRFTWKGKLIPPCSPSPALIAVHSLEPPLLQWQGAPEMVLTDLFWTGGLLRVETVWQPVLFWPLKMVWRVFKHPWG